MTCSPRSAPLFNFPDPELIIRTIRREKKQSATNQMVKRITLADNSKPSIEGRGGPILYPETPGHSFELKHHIIQLIQNHCQYHGLPNDDPNSHLDKFISLSNSYKQNGVSQDTIRLYLFPYSLTHHAHTWFEGLETASIPSWTVMATKFLTKYFPPSKQTKLRNDIMNFHQAFDESLYTAWERFKGALKKCPNHRLDKSAQLCTFYNGLDPNHRTTLDAAAQGSFMAKTDEEGWNLIENMTMHHHDWNSGDHFKSSAPIAAANPVPVEAIKALTEKMDSLVKQFGELKKQQHQVHQVQVCQHCNNPQSSGEYQVEYEEADGTVYYAQYPARPQNLPPGFNQNNNQPRGPPFPQRSNQPFQPRYPPRYPPYPQQQQLAYNQPLALPGPTSDANQTTEQTNKTNAPASSSDDAFTQFMQGQHLLNQKTSARQDQADLFMRNQLAVLKNLEAQIGQLAQRLDNRPRGSLPSNTVHNPHVEEAKQVTTTKEAATQPPAAIPVKEEQEVKIPAVEATPTLNKEVRIPYPARLKVQPKKLSSFKLDGKFLDTMSRVPGRNKYIRKLLSTKDKLPEINNIPLSSETSALLKNSLPEKLGDTGRFTLPCSIYQSGEISALADLGASINLMPYSLFKRLEIENLKPTKMTVQLADQSVRYPKGIAENVLVQVNKFFYPTDFVVMDIHEDINIPIILGRPFMNTARAVIDVYNHTIVLRSHGESITYKIDRPECTAEQEDCYAISTGRVCSDDESEPEEEEQFTRSSVFIDSDYDPEEDEEYREAEEEIESENEEPEKEERSETEEEEEMMAEVKRIQNCENYSSSEESIDYKAIRQELRTNHIKQMGNMLDSYLDPSKPFTRTDSEMLILLKKNCDLQSTQNYMQHST